MAILEDWGWDLRWADALGADAALHPGRVIEEQRGVYRLATAAGEALARVPGAMRHKSDAKAELPAVGDWVAVERVGGDAVIRRVLPRRTKLSRRASGEVDIEQVIAANLDAVLVMTALNADFNPRRLERFLAVSRESGAATVLVLNKLDACEDLKPFAAEAEAVAAGVPVVALSAKTGVGVERLKEWLAPGRTIGLIGTSGVGKSTLVNRLADAGLRTAATRGSDERGRHTTTHRQLFLVPGGGAVLDTPGMREMQFWDADRGVAQTFAEIDALAPSCRFKDCRHGSEPGCAVKEAAASGALAPARLEAWRKLQAELASGNRRADPAAAAEARRKDREADKALKKRLKEKRS